MAANEIYYKRKANHECTYCGAKLPDDYKLARCENCLRTDNEMAKYARKMALKQDYVQYARQGKRALVE